MGNEQKIDAPVEGEDNKKKGPTPEEVLADPSKELPPVTAEHVVSEFEKLAEQAKAFTAGFFGSATRDGSSLTGPRVESLYANAQFGDLSALMVKSGKLIGGDTPTDAAAVKGGTNRRPPAFASPEVTGIKAAEAGLDANGKPVVTNLDQAAMEKMIRLKNFEDPKATDAFTAKHGPLDLATERKTMEANIAAMSPENQAIARKGLEMLNERNMSDAQKAGVLASLNSLYKPENAGQLKERGVTTEQVNDQVAAALTRLGNPGIMPQGDNSSCALTASLQEMALKNPAGAADLIAQMYTSKERKNGNFAVEMPNGQKVEIHKSFLTGDTESKTALTPDGVANAKRDTFVRAMNLLSGNAVSQQRGEYYVDLDRGVSPGDSGERKLRPPSGENGFRALDNPALLAQDQVTRNRPVTDSSGKVVGSKTEVVKDPEMTDNAIAALQISLGNGTIGSNERTVGAWRPGANVKGIEGAGDMDALLAGNGGIASIGVDSRHGLFQSTGQGGYGGMHQIMNLGTFKTADGKEVYMISTWGKIGMVEKGDLVNSMKPKEEHKAVSTADYTSPEASREGKWNLRQMQGGDQAPGGSTPGGKPVDGQNRPDGKRPNENDPFLDTDQHLRDQKYKDQKEQERSQQEQKDREQRERDEAKEAQRKKDEAAKRRKGGPAGGGG